MLDINKLEDNKFLNSKVSYMRTTQATEVTSSERKPYTPTQSSVVPESSLNRRQYVTTWNYTEEKPQVVVTSNRNQTFVADYDVGRKEIVSRIVSETSRNQRPSESTKYVAVDVKQPSRNYHGLVFGDSGKTDRIVQKINVESIHEVDHKYAMHEVHHIERPLRLQTLEQVTRSWEAKHLVLERQRANLQNLLDRGMLYGKQEKREIKVENGYKLVQVQGEIQALEDQIRQRDQVIDQLQGKEEDLEQKLEETNNAEQFKRADEELAQWKKKFMDLNKKFHDLQEDLMMKQAELESLKNRQQKMVVTKTVQSKNMRSSNASNLSNPDAHLARELTGNSHAR